MPTYSNYSGHAKTTSPHGSQVKRNLDGGGVVFDARLENQFRRWLVLGSDKQTFYAAPEKLTRANVAFAMELLKKDPRAYVDTIVDVRKRGLSPRNDTAIFAFALVYVEGNKAAKQYATEHIGEVCRTGDNIQEFVSLLTGERHGKQRVNYMRGWGRSVRTAVRSWFEQRGPRNATYQAIKYRARHGTSMEKLVKLSHPKTSSPDLNTLYGWLVGREFSEHEMLSMVGNRNLEQLWAFEQAKATVNRSTNEAIWAQREYLIRLIEKYRLPWEAVPNQWLVDSEVLKALAKDMAIGAMVRYLSTFTRRGVFEDYNARQMILGKLSNPDIVKADNIHPIKLLVAHMTYKSGQGERSSWTPNREVVAALESAFYMSFGNITPTGKYRMVALDVSPSMGRPYYKCLGLDKLTPREASAFLAMLTVRTEPWYYLVGFAGNLVELNITADMSFDQVVRSVSGLRWGGTDISAPMVAAARNNLPVDMFEIYTDNEFNSGIRPDVALTQYQEKMGRPARLASNAMLSYPGTIADPNRSDMLDLIGFNPDTPGILSKFALGELDFV